MGKCRFCGKSAGFLRSEHRECAEQHAQGEQAIARLIAEVPFSSTPHIKIAEQVKAIADRSFITEVQGRQLYIQDWSAAVDRYLHDGVISEEKENWLMEVKDELLISRADLEQNGSWERVVKSAVIRDLLAGVLSTRMRVDGNLDLNLQKGEQVVWAFPHAEFLEDRVHRQYVGGSQGVSVRVMKGVYYHIGSFKGQAIDRTERVHVDTGLMAVTNKNIYFGGPRKSLRLPYSKIVSFQPFSNGLGVTRDAASAKPQIFVTGDGWFTYNLVMNLAHL